MNPVWVQIYDHIQKKSEIIYFEDVQSSVISAILPFLETPKNESSMQPANHASKGSKHVHHHLKIQPLLTNENKQHHGGQRCKQRDKRKQNFFHFSSFIFSFTENSHLLYIWQRHFKSWANTHYFSFLAHEQKYSLKYVMKQVECDQFNIVKGLIKITL